jgi:c-di-GMP-binding flagellar brake protein YcgR
VDGQAPGGAVDAFLGSLRAAFRAHGDGSAAALGAAAAAVALLVATLVVLSRRRRARARRVAFAGAVAARGLGAEDAALVEGLAAAHDEPALDLLTSLAAFERATARALGRSAPGDLPVRIRRLRRALGFDRLGPRGSLLTTRELEPGTRVALAGVRGEVRDVDEARVVVDADRPLAFSTGAAVPLALVRPGEARYEARCPLLATSPDGRRLALAHDERPVRHQLRAFVRVPVRRPVELAPRPGPGGGPPAAAEALRGWSRDVSEGGLLVLAPRALAAGARVECAFALEEGGAPFAIEAEVIAAKARGGDGVELHLEFARLEPATRDRLAAAIVRLDQRATTGRG